MRRRKRPRSSRKKKAQTRARQRPVPQPRPNPLERLLTAPQLEEALQIDVKTIYHYVTKKIIPHVRIVTNVRFREKDILRWIERHTYRPPWMRSGARHRRR